MGIQRVFSLKSRYCKKERIERIQPLAFQERKTGFDLSWRLQHVPRPTLMSTFYTSDLSLFKEFCAERPSGNFN
jgi:hypothetical protein